MTSKEIINKYIKDYEQNLTCMHNPKIMKQEMELINEMKQIKRDLEMLEQIKVKIDEEIKRQEKVIIEYDNYAWKTQQLNNEFRIAVNVKNTLEKIKEGLENE